MYLKANNNENITIIPALTGLGAPHWNSRVRGAIFGLTRNTSIADIVKATLQSIAYQTFDLIHCMEKDAGKKMKEMRVDGGMVNNDNFIQFLSDVLQINIIRPKNIETTALGAAYLAGLFSGIIKDIVDIEKLWQYKNKFKPKMTKKTRDNQVKNWHYHIHKLLNYKEISR